MRMTKKLTAVVMIICIGITALTGCGKKTVSKAVLKNDMEKTEINDIGVSKDDSQPYWGTYVHTFAAADGGYYYIGKWNNAFFLLFLEIPRNVIRCAGKRIAHMIIWNVMPMLGTSIQRTDRQQHIIWTVRFIITKIMYIFLIRMGIL